MIYIMIKIKYFSTCKIKQLTGSDCPTILGVYRFCLKISNPDATRVIPTLQRYCHVVHKDQLQFVYHALNNYVK